MAREEAKNVETVEDVINNEISARNKTDFNDNVAAISQIYGDSSDLPVVITDTTGQGTHIASGFEDMGMGEELLRGVYGVGFKTPSKIQMTAVPPLMAGRDLRAQAQSGTGKTAAFGIGSLYRVNKDLDKIQVIIIEPTRELAIQTSKVLKGLATYTKITVEPVYGGSRLNDSLSAINRKPHVVVATPGRLKHIIEKQNIDLSEVKVFILDEADELLNEGFINDIHNIYNSISSSGLQIAMFSATWNKTITETADKILKHEVRILLKGEEQTLKGLKQFYVNHGEHRGIDLDLSKVDTLKHIYETRHVAQSIIFCNSILRAENLQKVLQEKGFTCGLFHSKLTQDERNHVIDELRTGKVRILVSSGGLSRGLDVQTISLVINFDIPDERDMEEYIHRIGRSGRFGRKGIAINLISEQETDLVKKYEEHYETKIDPLPQDFSI